MQVAHRVAWRGTGLMSGKGPVVAIGHTLWVVARKLGDVASNPDVRVSFGALQAKGML